jgi:hypothetical protein
VNILLSFFIWSSYLIYELLNKHFSKT